MAKNRKYQSAALRYGPAFKAFLLCLLIGGSGVGYVWQKNQIYELGQQIKKRELRLARRSRRWVDFRPIGVMRPVERVARGADVR